MRSPACSDSMLILSEACVPVSTTSGLRQDFTSMRPLPIFWMTTTGLPFTVKCFSKCCGPACAGAAGHRNIPAPSTGSTLRPTSRRLILVYAPAAIHHLGE